MGGRGDRAGERSVVIPKELYAKAMAEHIYQQASDQTLSMATQEGIVWRDGKPRHSYQQASGPMGHGESPFCYGS